ncbi:uncharacterized protein VTP21DRAFT_8189 [Calcarisporiella thermophila]|uniref:uncharacterized protein n=1 Tax=Calcarisporiella thermophila TaxID=911321 RepID=UPI003741EE9C
MSTNSRPDTLASSRQLPKVNSLQQQHQRPFTPDLNPPRERRGSQPLASTSNGSRSGSPALTSPRSIPPSLTNSDVEGSPKMASGKKHPKDLLNVVSGVVSNRHGSVLTRGNILKADHFPSGRNPHLDFHLQGAPNFRMVDLNVFGVAQPTTLGLSTILAVLNCHPKSSGSARCVWVSTREEPLVYLNGSPYVLRDASAPFQNLRIYSGISASRLEMMEERLKADIIKETKRMGGLLLVHDELDDGSVVPCWIAADTVQSPREVFTSFQEQGYKVRYARIPISPDQAPEDNYLDEYVNVIKELPPTDPLIFNCGMGVVRTTFGMVVALLIRRAQLISQGQPDPFPIPGYISGDITIPGLEEAEELRMQNRSILRLVYVLEQGLKSKMSPRSAIEWALARGPLIDSLKNAIQGNYLCILGLASVLDSGTYSKKLLDALINRCDAVVNLREIILMHRVRYTVSSEESASHLQRARGALERYFFLLCFAAYVNESSSAKFEISFSRWLEQRAEIRSMLENLRKRAQLYLFRPVDDLSLFSGGPMEEDDATGVAGFGKMMRVGKQLGNELELHVTQNRSGIVLGPHTILKIDQWTSNKQARNHVEDSSGRQAGSISGGMDIEGAYNFRRVAGTHIYGVAQPTYQGIKNVVELIREEQPGLSQVLWINLREEPIIYINGVPYVLRDKYFTLRNLRSYAGITSQRLELLETRLKEDVVSELEYYGDKLLLHSETPDGKIEPVWEEVTAKYVQTIKEVMEEVGGAEIDYHRVPVTAEASPELKDFQALISLLSRVDWKRTAIVVNCQVGLGRSTTGTVICSLIERWLSLSRTATTPYTEPSSPFYSSGGRSRRLSRSSSVSSLDYNYHPVPRPPTNNYQIIHALLRVIRNGLECKNVVDETIDNCAPCLNLRDTIETFRVQAENASDPAQKKQAIKRGVASLERYFLLVAFAAYLDETPADTVTDLESFSGWMDRHQELSTLLNELQRSGLDALVPVEKIAPGDGVALSSEVIEVVQERRGAVLAQGTILKHDAFPGCQKMSLPEKIEGAPNYRRVPFASIADLTYPDEAHGEEMGSSVMGCAMPTKDGMRLLLTRASAAPQSESGESGRRIVWTSLREEPVLYVNKRPFVLRLFQDPVRNLIFTGIAQERVELMEVRMKEDVLNEIKKYGGRVLLHDEELLPQGGFSVIPVWETVLERDVQTPAEVFSEFIAEGYRVSYARIPITDEQAPIPLVFDQLVERIKGLGKGDDVLFNCQMGRGRTTTGMVIACLMNMILNHDTDVYSLTTSTPADRRLPITPGGTEESDPTREEDDSLRYLQGEYKLILQVVSVLTYGKLAKRLTDIAIDACHHMQNLREAIYDFLLRVESTPPGPKQEALREVGLNYLIRYFYLIVFADYLLEEVRSGGSLRFSEWLKGRREITHICRAPNQELC